MRKAMIGVFAVVVAAFAYAGVRDIHVHQFPPPDFAYKELPVSIRTLGSATGYDALGREVMHFKVPSACHTVASPIACQPWIIHQISTVSRVMAGTITDFKLQVTNNTFNVLKAAVDCYGAELLHAGTIDIADLQGMGATTYSPTVGKPVVWKPGDEIRVYYSIAGTNTPSATDTTFRIVYRYPVGQEAQ